MSKTFSIRINKKESIKTINDKIRKMKEFIKSYQEESSDDKVDMKLECATCRFIANDIEEACDHWIKNLEDQDHAVFANNNKYGKIIFITIDNLEGD